jgi:hypothetical protein
MSNSRLNKNDLVMLVTIIIGMAIVVTLSRTIDKRRPPVDHKIEEEKLYVSGNTAKRMSLGFNGLIADWYWMRSLQYVGRKVLELPPDVPLDDLGDLDLRLLAPLLDTASTLDPAFMEPYEYAAIVLPAIDVDAAIRITKKGIAANPSSWKLYYHLGYIYWQRGDFQAAADTYGAGALLPNAPMWMMAMKGKMAAEGGSRSTAREVYKKMLEQAADKKVQEMAMLRLMQLDSLDQRDAIRKVLTSYKTSRGGCPASWPEVAAVLQSMRFKLSRDGAPLDPTGAPYQLVESGCDVALDAKSPIPVK